MGETIFIPELWKDNLETNLNNQLEDKVDIRTFANLSKDVQWLVNNHVLPDTYNTQIQQLLNKINNLKTKLNTIKTIKTESKIDTLQVTTNANDYLLHEVASDSMVIVSNFYFQTSDESNWHDLSHNKIKDVLGLSNIKQTIVGDNKQIILQTQTNDWWRKHVFTNYYSLKYKLEYITTDNITLL